MADKKISQLTAVSTPLAGTEVLPIVQSGATKKVTALELTGTTLDAFGNVTIPEGNLVQGTAAKGINFTANTPAAGKTSQLLNWYEEGTFTPTIIGTTSAGTGTYTAQYGFYTRIGRVVYYVIQLGWSAHTGTGAMKLSGLPFTSAANQAPPASVMSYDMALPANTTLYALVNESATTIEFLGLPVGGGAWTSVNMDSAVAALLISGLYFV